MKKPTVELSDSFLDHRQHHVIFPYLFYQVEVKCEKGRWGPNGCGADNFEAVELIN